MYNQCVGNLSHSQQLTMHQPCPTVMVEGHGYNFDGHHGTTIRLGHGPAMATAEWRPAIDRTMLLPYGCQPCIGRCKMARYHESMRYGPAWSMTLMSTIWLKTMRYASGSWCVLPACLLPLLIAVLLIHVLEGDSGCALTLHMGCMDDWSCYSTVWRWAADDTYVHWMT